MKLYDISMTLSSRLPTWPGDPAFELVQVASLGLGDPVNVSSIRLSAHFGTHIDAPCHVIADGSSVAEIPIDLLVGEAWIAHIPEEARAVTAELLQTAGIPVETTRLLLRTHNSRLWDNDSGQFVEDYVGLTGDAADWVVRRGIRLLGIDYLSVDLFGASGLPAHHALLGSGIPIIEGLDLRLIPAGSYTVYCLPMKLEGADGAPARVVLLG